MGAAGAESAFENAAVADERAERGFDGLRVEGEARGGFRSGEGAVGPGVAADDLENSCCDGRCERFGQIGRENYVESVAIAGRVFDRDQPLLVRDPDLEDATRADEAVDGLQ